MKCVRNLSTKFQSIFQEINISKTFFKRISNAIFFEKRFVTQEDTKKIDLNCVYNCTRLCSLTKYRDEGNNEGKNLHQ